MDLHTLPQSAFIVHERCPNEARWARHRSDLLFQEGLPTRREGKHKPQGHPLRAFFPRALRRQGQDQEADEQEIWIRKKVREQLPAGLGLSGRRGLLPFLLDDGEKLGTSSIVQRIGLDYFKAPEIVDVSTGTVYVPIRTPGGRGMLTTVGHPPFFKPGDDLFFLLSEEKRG
jgi:hypothetical protein